MTPNNLKVAIFQTPIIMGGRLRVVIGIAEILNDLGVVPDIITSQLRFNPQDVAENYGKQIRAHYRLIPRIPRLSHEFAIVAFNLMIRRYASHYDLLINTNNSMIFLPSRPDVLTYMFYPRKSRIMANAADIHQPDKKIPIGSLAHIRKTLLKQLYRFSTTKPNQHTICMTKFTCESFKHVYHTPAHLPVIYPPVDIHRFASSSPNKQRAVVTLGRFSPGKRQLEQIQLAECMPDTLFYIIGFANNNLYYQQCKNYVEMHKIKNVHLYPDAPFSEILNLLQNSRYFLHTLINEPFGITAVQAIAAGCLPIVHDSGGQRETVPDERLRYRHLNEVPDILKTLENFSTKERQGLAQKLRTHVAENFDASVFKEKMKSELVALLGI